MRKQPFGSKNKGFSPKGTKALAEVCNLCGACEAVCPIYRLTGLETLVARGKMALVRFSDIPSQRPFRGCLLCGACKAGCSAGADAPEVVRRQRKEGLGGLNFALSLWRNDPAREAVVDLLRRGTGLALRISGLKVPELPRPDLATVAQMMGANAPREIAIFTGCGGNYLFPEASYSLWRLLNGRAYFPAEQTCCGLPFLSLGLKEEARELARRNLKALAGARVIITPCVSCAAALKEYPNLLTPSEGKAATEILKRLKGPEALLPRPKRITPFAFHIPCHLRFSLKEEAPFVEAMREIFGETFSPLERVCCGFGGLLPLLERKLAYRILEKRVAGLPEDVPVVTNCTACLIALRQKLPKEKVRHLYTFWLDPEEATPWPPY